MWVLQVSSQRKATSTSPCDWMACKDFRCTATWIMFLTMTDISNKIRLCFCSLKCGDFSLFACRDVKDKRNHFFVCSGIFTRKKGKKGMTRRRKKQEDGGMRKEERSLVKTYTSNIAHPSSTASFPRLFVTYCRSVRVLAPFCFKIATLIDSLSTSSGGVTSLHVTLSVT